MNDISLRDLFAVHISPIAWTEAVVMANMKRIDEEKIFEAAATMAYLVADAMVAALVAKKIQIYERIVSDRTYAK